MFFKELFKIIFIVAVFFAIKCFVFAVDSDYKNTLLKVDIRKTKNGSFNIVLNTQKPYVKPLGIMKRSDTEYVIILPETYSSNVQLPDISGYSSEIADIDVRLFPYLNSDSTNGFTKVTISTTSKLAFSPVFYSAQPKGDTIASLYPNESSKPQQKFVIKPSEPIKRQLQQKVEVKPSEAEKPLSKPDVVALAKKEPLMKEQAKILPEQKPEAKQKPELKPENMPEIKPEVNPEVKPEVIATESLPVAEPQLATPEQPPLLEKLAAKKVVVKHAIEKTKSLTKVAAQRLDSVASRVSSVAQSGLHSAKLGTLTYLSIFQSNLKSIFYILMTVVVSLLTPILVFIWFKKRIDAVEVANIRVVTPKLNKSAHSVVQRTPKVREMASAPPVVEVEEPIKVQAEPEKVVIQPAAAPEDKPKTRLTRFTQRSLDEQEDFSKFEIPDKAQSVFAKPIKFIKARPTVAEPVEQKQVEAVPVVAAKPEPVEVQKVTVPFEPVLVAEAKAGEGRGFYLIRYEDYLALIGYAGDSVFVLKKLKLGSADAIQVALSHSAGENDMYLLKAGEHKGLYRVSSSEIKFIMPV